jgi:hypothetical protein
LNVIFFSLVGALVSSRLPVALAIFLFFTDDELIEWALRKIGIRLVLHTLGCEFIKAFVFFAGSSALLAYAKESVPEWLSPWMVPASSSWGFVVGMSLLVAILKTVAATVIREVLPRVGIEIARDSVNWTIVEALVGLSMFGLLALLVSTLVVVDTVVLIGLSIAGTMALFVAALIVLDWRRSH